MFELYGEVVSAKVAIDRETRKSRGFGFFGNECRPPASGGGKDPALLLRIMAPPIDALNGARLRGGKGTRCSGEEAEEKPRDSNSGGGYRPPTEII